MQPSSERVPRRGFDFSQELAEKGWYHSFDLPDGTHLEGYNPLDVLTARYARFPIPADLHGKRVLDIGAWDGWFSFEAERRGASVTAIDCIEVPTFLEVRAKLSSHVDYKILDFYELTETQLGGKFDFVFFLGILYHLKHPLLALEMVCALTTDTAIVESFVTDANTWQEHREEVPAMEFYETDELGNQMDNWIGPSVGCLLAMCRAAGFARVELLHSSGRDAGVVCYRKWEPVPTQPQREAPELIAVANNRSLGINFSTRKEEYISCWFRASEESIAREQLRFEVGGFGVPALYVRHDESGAWLANFRLPPGLSEGWNAVRLRFADSEFGKTILRIAIDKPLDVDRLVVQGVCDGLSWSDGEVKVTEGGFLSSWVTGLPDNCDRSNVRVYLGQTRLWVDYISEPDAHGYRQINAAVPRDAAKGEQPFRVECAGVTSGPRPVKIG
jgi:tRNA (mo5U34)-methyltransferase